MKNTGILYEFQDIICRPCNPEMKDIQFQLVRPRAILEKDYYGIVIYFNCPHPNKSPYITFLYRHEFYSRMCLGNYDIIFNKNKDTEIFPKLLYDYLSTYSSHGFLDPSYKSINTCPVCKRENVKYENEKVCMGCMDKTKNIPYYAFDDENIVSSNKFYWCSRSGCLVYTGEKTWD